MDKIHIFYRKFITLKILRINLRNIRKTAFIIYLIINVIVLIVIFYAFGMQIFILLFY